MGLKRPLVICASQRYKASIDSFVNYLQKRGVLVFQPNFRRHRKKFIRQPERLRMRSSAYKAKVPGMVLSHFSKLRKTGNLGGLCLVFNPTAMEGQSKAHGYIGSNTQAEISHAHALDITVLLLKPHEEEWIMSIVEKEQVFTLERPKGDPMDFDAVYEWLRPWIGDM